MSVLAHPSVAAVVLLTASSVFMTFAVLYMGQALELDSLCAERCLLGAVYFIFRG